MNRSLREDRQPERHGRVREALDHTRHSDPLIGCIEISLIIGFRKTKSTRTILLVDELSSDLLLCHQRDSRAVMGDRDLRELLTEGGALRLTLHS